MRECVEFVELTRWTRVLFKYCQNLPSQATFEIPGLSPRDVLFKTHQIRHAAVHRRPTSICETEEMIGNAISLTTILKDPLRTKRIELIRKEVGVILEELKRIQNGLEPRMSEELVMIADSKRSLDGREEKTIDLMLSEGNQNRSRLGSRLDELLIPRLKGTGSDFLYPEEMSCAEVGETVLKVEDFGGGQDQWKEKG